MIKALLFTLLFISISVSSLISQTLPKDSIIGIAKADARNFRLNKIDLKKFRQSGKNYYSDYFKPVKANARDSVLLKDSVYVKAFRAAAYAKTKKRRTVGHYVAVGGVVYVGLSLVATVIALGILFHSLK